MKGLKGILILLIIISISAIIYITFFVEPIHEYTYEEYRIMMEGENPELEAALKIRIFPENKEYLEENYNGNIDLNYFYEKIYNLVHKNIEPLQKELKGLNINGLKEYLANNQNDLISTVGITNIEQLNNLSNNISRKSIKEEEYINSGIIQDTYVEGEEYDTVNLKINYENDSIFFKIKIANDMLTSPMIILESIGGENK